MEKGTRYPQASVLPDDSVLVSGGSEDYRGRGDSNILQARLYHPDQNTFDKVADPLVGRNYHSGSLLLPDGRVMFFGSDSLYGDAANTKPGTFERRRMLHAAVSVPGLTAVAVGRPADDRAGVSGDVHVPSAPRRSRRCG
ncbi:hypothetical protein SALBM311S_10661 [Streptomyces alboniger]